MRIYARAPDAAHHPTHPTHASRGGSSHGGSSSWVCVAHLASRQPAQHMCWGSHGGLVLTSGPQLSRLARTLQPSDDVIARATSTVAASSASRSVFDVVRP